MTVLSVCNHKGGTGKTTSAIHLAAALGLSGYKTLVIDLDPQGFLSRTLGIKEPPEEASSLALFDHQVQMSEVAVLSFSAFDVLPSSTTLTKAMRSLNKPTDVLWAKEALQTGLSYDMVIFDTAAAVTVFSLNALVASEFVLIPVTPEYQPVLGGEQTYQTIQLVQDRLNPDLRNPYFLFTQVDARKRDHFLYRRYMRQKYGEQVMRALIRTSTSLSEMHPDGTTAFEHDAHSRGARDYANAADELLKRMQAQPLPDAPDDGEDGEPLDSLDAPPTPEGDAPEDGADEGPQTRGQREQGTDVPSNGWTPIHHLGS